jgi:hypothetical protein
VVAQQVIADRAEKANDAIAFKVKQEFSAKENTKAGKEIEPKLATGILKSTA